jgi:hypothetical protein
MSLPSTGSITSSFERVSLSRFFCSTSAPMRCFNGLAMAVGLWRIWDREIPTEHFYECQWQ